MNFFKKSTSSYRFKCSQNIASLNVLMILTVSMTVSHLYQNLENIKVSEALNRLLKFHKIHPQSFYQ